MKKELIQLLKGKNAYIQTHDFPDPDALATAFALQEYLKYYGIEATICYEGKLERASAIRMLDNFGIQVKGGQTKGALPEDACVVLVDSQNQNSNVTDIGGQKSACIDHHPVHHECEYAYRDIRKTGACATIVASYFVEDGIIPKPNVAAALAYGIKMDTADFTRGTTQKDTDMFAYLFRYADWDLVQNMYADTLELADLSAYEAAIQSIEIYDRVGFAFIPFECQPALIAMISDFMKALDGVDVVIVYARQEDGIRFAVRSDEKRVNVGVLLKEMLHGIGDGGGHPAMAGGCISKEIAERLGDTLHETVKRRFMQGIQEMRDGKSIEMRNV